MTEIPDAIDFAVTPGELLEMKSHAAKNLGHWLFGGKPWRELDRTQQSRAHSIVEVLLEAGLPCVLRAEDQVVSFAFVTPSQDRLLYQYTSYPARGFGLEKLFTAPFGPALLGYAKAA